MRGSSREVRGEARLRLRPLPSTEQQQAQALVDAVDAGGLPLNPARVNQIARQLGLEVSVVEEQVM